MKADIHPDYKDVNVTCSCGNTFVTKSTADKLTLELCNECHPFFTGRQKLVDSGGRVERFQKRYANAPVQSKKRQKAEASPGAAESSDTE